MSDSTTRWRDFPRTLPEFEARFPDEEACRRYLIEVRWDGVVVCSKCGWQESWELECGRFECQRCHHQTSITAGTPLHGTRKPLKIWFRAIWEITVRNNGVSAKDLQRIMGFGSYRTAWTWLHKLRSCMRRQKREPLGGTVVVDDAYIGGRDNRPGRPNGNKAVLLVAAEAAGRVRLEHAPNLQAITVRNFVDRNVAPDASVTTDAYQSFISGVGNRRHVRINQKRRDLSQRDYLQHAHYVISLFKRLWIGTYHGAVRWKHLQAYMDEFEFRYNRRKTQGRGRLVARLFESLANLNPITYQDLTAAPLMPRFSQT